MASSTGVARHNLSLDGAVMPKSKRHSSRKTPTKKNAEKSVVPHCPGGMGWFSGPVSPAPKPSPLKDIKIDPDPPDSYPKFCAWLVQILEFVQPVVASGQSYDDDDGEFEYAADVQPHVEQIKTALTNAAHRIKHFPALMAKCDTMYRPGGLSTFVRKLRHDIDRGSVDRLSLERISDAIEGEAGDSALPAEHASVVEPPDARHNAPTADLANGAVGKAESSSSIDKIPPLDKENGEWVNQKRAAKIVQRDVQTLANDRTAKGGGIKTEDGLCGIGRHGRIWRKESFKDQEIWYLKSSLSSEPTRSIQPVTPKKNPRI